MGFNVLPALKPENKNGEEQVGGEQIYGEKCPGFWISSPNIFTGSIFMLQMYQENNSWIFCIPDSLAALESPGTGELDAPIVITNKADFFSGIPVINTEKLINKGILVSPLCNDKQTNPAPFIHQGWMCDLSEMGRNLLSAEIMRMQGRIQAGSGGGMKRKCSREKKTQKTNPTCFFKEDYRGKILANQAKEEMGDRTVVMCEM